MTKVVLTIVSTLVFGLLGLLIGWLNIQAHLETITHGSRISSDLLLVSYGVAPLTGALLGFLVNVIAIKLFAPSRNA
jgi:hypothetical protein